VTCVRGRRVYTAALNQVGVRFFFRPHSRTCVKNVAAECCRRRRRLLPLLLLLPPPPPPPLLAMAAGAVCCRLWLNVLGASSAIFDTRITVVFSCMYLHSNGTFLQIFQIIKN
jgi:hypothetical protein